MYLYDRNDNSLYLKPKLNNNSLKASILSNMSALSNNSSSINPKTNTSLSSSASSSSSSYSIGGPMKIHEKKLVNSKPARRKEVDDIRFPSYEYSYSSTSSSSPKSTTNNDSNLFIDENFENNKKINDDRQFYTLPHGNHKERKSLFNLLSSMQQPVVQPINQNENKNNLSAAPALSLEKSKLIRKENEINSTNYLKQQKPEEKQLFDNYGVHEISNKLFYYNTEKFKASRNQREKLGNSLNTSVNNHVPSRTSEIYNEPFSKANRFYSLRRILGKKLSKTDLAMCSRPREAEPMYDNKVKSPRKEPESVANHKVLNLLKIYKNVLNRLQKTFNSNESSNNLASPTTSNSSISKSNELFTKSQQHHVDKSTQTQNYAQIHSSPLSHKSLYSSTSSASTSASSSNYNNKQQLEENKDELFDLKCDLEVASYFDRNIDYDHQQNYIYNKNLYSNNGYFNNDQKHLFSTNNFKTYVNNNNDNNNNNYYHYYYNNYFNKENLSDFGTLC